MQYKFSLIQGAVENSSLRSSTINGNLRISELSFASLEKQAPVTFDLNRPGAHKVAIALFLQHPHSSLLWPSKNQQSQESEYGIKEQYHNVLHET